MPILRQGDKRLYCVHLPNTPLLPFYCSLLSHGYVLSNLGPVTGDLGDQKAAMAQTMLNRFEIRSFQKEGDFSRVTSSLQYATFDAWSNWGPFDYSFAIVRDPMSRFSSAVNARYLQQLRKNGASHTDQAFAAFQRKMLDYLKNQYPKQQHAFDNSFRSMMNFVLPQTRLYSFEAGGMDKLRADLGLESFEVGAPRFIALTDEQLISHAQEMYADDLALYARTFCTGEKK